MLTLRRIEVANFVCFDNLVLEPSTDPTRPLTVIRAGNGCGKTTFLRALRWCMYGENGLPTPAQRFSLHPAWWQPNRTGLTTQVSIEFETDGSSRNNEPNEAAVTTLYQFTRSVRTKDRPVERDDLPNFQRLNEKIQLIVRTPDGQWEPHPSPDSVVEELLPWGLRDFFVMDADEATDFVGGADETTTASQQDVEIKTTKAVQSLLGIEVFKNSCERVGRIAEDFGRKATKAIGKSDLSNLQDRLDDLRTDYEHAGDEIRGERLRESELADQLARHNDELEKELLALGAFDELKERLKRNLEEYELATADRKHRLAVLADDLESIDLLAGLSSRAVTQTYKDLKPLHDQGDIPLKHLQFVRSLLESGRCVCGQNLTHYGEHREHVEKRIAESSEKEQFADYLHQLYDASLSLVEHTAPSNWNEGRITHAADLAACDERLIKLELEKKTVDAKLARIDEYKIQVIREARAATEKQLDICRRGLTSHIASLPELSDQIESLTKQIGQRQRNERAAADHLEAEQLARLVYEVLDRAYRNIEREQVAELSVQMNRLFQEMNANISDEDFVEFARNQASFRMINEVGVRPVEYRPDRFEIYALNHHGRAMPPTEINGAARRVLALSFVLALCIESQTHAPLIADSLLNTMEGVVRRNTLWVTAQHSPQPILLLTYADLEALSEIETVASRAGAVYTFTCAAGAGGNIVNQAEQPQAALLCTCGPRQYCDICERSGQAESPSWMKRYD